jgi:hypothetical protein
MSTTMTIERPMFPPVNPTMRRLLAIATASAGSAFSTLDGDVYDLTRAARLASEQLHRAVGELRCDGEKYLEAPDAAILS